MPLKMKRSWQRAQTAIEFVLLVLFVVLAMAVVINNLKKEGGGMFDIWCKFSLKIAQGCPECKPIQAGEKPCPK